MSKVPKTPATRTRIWDGVIPGTHEPGFVEPALKEFDAPGHLTALKSAAVLVRTFQFGECSVILSREDPDGQGLRWHLSIAHTERHPTWDEIKTVRYRICGPDIVMAMILPRAVDYVNVPRQDHVFQLWELIGDEAYGW